MESLFSKLYSDAKYPDGSLLENAQAYVDFIQTFIKEKNISSVVEVGCSDWKVSRYISWDEIDYLGIDPVKSVIEENKRKYGTSNVRFAHADALSIDLPAADLVICKDVLQHLTNEDVLSFLAKTKHFKHCLLINDIRFVDQASRNNYEIQRGGYRSIDFNKKPFKANGIPLFNFASGNTIKQVFYIKNGPGDPLPIKDTKKVLIAILAKNKAHMLPNYLKCIAELEYDKKLVVIYIRTNNNKDSTRQILADWVIKHRCEYLDVIFEDEDVAHAVDSKPHNWPQERLKLLAGIRNRSLEKAKEYRTDFYFVADCDNFVFPHTLKYLIDKDKPMIAPMLRPVPGKDDPYCNFFCDIDPKGYWRSDPDYYKILNNSLIGTFKVPLVHCTYLIKTECLDRLNYLDTTNSLEFVVISRFARQNGIDQYICNEREFGTLYHPESYDISLEDEVINYQMYLEE